MSLKIGIIAGLVVVGFAVLCFISPSFYILVSSLVMGIKNEATAQRTLIGSGQKIKYRKKTTDYQDWNTGSNRTRTQFTLYFDGSALDSKDLKKLIEVKNPGAADNPTVYDAVEMQADDLLVALSKDGQGVSYLIARFHLDTAKKLQVDLVKLGKEDSQYNWFPNSRLPGWSRVISTDDNQFMIQHSPFKVIPLGAGDLINVEFPYAFMAANQYKKDDIYFSQVNLNDGKVVADLALSKECFVMPRFSMNHPLLEDDDMTESDDEVKFNYGPKWWAKTIAPYSGNDGKLKLALGHPLLAPAQKVISVVNPRPPKYPQPVAANSSNEPQAESPDFFGEEEIDRIPMITRQCAKENPEGFTKAQKLPATAQTVSISEFCLDPNWAVNAEQKAKVCGIPTRKKVFSKNTLTINETTITYHPSAKDSKPISVTVPEIQTGDKKMIYITHPESQEMQSIKEYFIISDNQVLIKARTEGPWNMYVLTANEDKVKVNFMGSFAYPGSELEETEDKDFLYMRRSSILIRKNPLGYLDRLLGFLATKQKNAASFYVMEDEKELHLHVRSFEPDMSAEAKILWSAKIATKCFGDDLPNAEMTVNQREAWLKKYFNWSTDNDKLILRQTLGQSGCTLNEYKDKP